MHWEDISIVVEHPQCTDDVPHTDRHIPGLSAFNINFTVSHVLQNDAVISVFLRATPREPSLKVPTVKKRPLGMSAPKPIKYIEV